MAGMPPSTRVDASEIDITVIFCRRPFSTRTPCLGHTRNLRCRLGLWHVDNVDAALAGATRLLLQLPFQLLACCVNFVDGFTHRRGHVRPARAVHELFATRIQRDVGARRPSSRGSVRPVLTTAVSFKRRSRQASLLSTIRRTPSVMSTCLPVSSESHGVT